VPSEREKNAGRRAGVLHVWVGGGAIILPGVCIGSRAVIGAGSVVTRDVPDDVFAAGNPCRIIREIIG
jgi:maltose O-acetyltransferase